MVLVGEYTMETLVGWLCMGGRRPGGEGVLSPFMKRGKELLKQGGRKRGDVM